MRPVEPRVPAPGSRRPVRRRARAGRAVRALGALLGLVGAVAATVVPASVPPVAPTLARTVARTVAPRLSPDTRGAHGAGFTRIDRDDLTAHVLYLAAPELEGRDTPSAGLARAASYLAAAFREAGLSGAVDAEGDAAFLWTYRQSAAVPEPAGCRLELTVEDAEPDALRLGEDYVPVLGASGEAEGEPIFLGFGIDSRRERYNDLKGRAYRGKVAVVVEGEPRHDELFEGPELTREADLYAKLEELEERGVRGVLVVRRPLRSDREGAPPPPPLSFRHTWAAFVGESPPVVERIEIPVLEVTAAAAERILGRSVAPAIEEMDRRGRPVRFEAPGRRVRLASASRPGAAETANVVGVLRGTDPELAGEYVVLGAHYDHLGVDPRGRVGLGADDNASGTAALLELVEALAAAGPRRSILACAFAGEEDDLLGSRALCADPPVPVAAMVAMLNLDMVGRGEADEVVVIGARRNRALSDVLERARALGGTRIERIETGKGRDLFERSDHFAFHEVGVPVLFFYEGWPLSDNPDYHTWRDTVDELDFDKITNTTRLVYNTAWLLANDDDRPPPSRF